MWSLGCVTVVLLTGVIPEIDLQSTEDKSANPQTTLQTVENEGANNLNEHIKWQSVSRRPKDFVNCLLEFDESRRMTAQQALEHEWFTNPNHKSAFDEVYRKSIAGWKPRAIVPEVVEIKIALLSKKRVLDVSVESKARCEISTWLIMMTRVNFANRSPSPTDLSNHPTILIIRISMLFFPRAGL